jgi:hypothetical protein
LLGHIGYPERERERERQSRAARRAGTDSSHGHGVVFGRRKWSDLTALGTDWICVLEWSLKSELSTGDPLSHKSQKGLRRGNNDLKKSYLI